MLNDIVGRKKEIQVLESLKESKKSEFLAVYGRRRVGKTYLIGNVFEGEFTFQLKCSVNTKLQWQLANFYRTSLIVHPKSQQEQYF